MQTHTDTKGFDPAHVDTINDPLTAPHRKHLQDRGLSDQTIAAARLFSVSPAEAGDTLGRTIGCPGIALPYQDPFNKTVSLTRVRPDTPPTIKGKPAKYLSPRGAGNAVYYPPECESWINDPSVVIGITEGEFKTLWAYQAGVNLVGLSGVTCWRGKDSQTGKSGPITDLDLIPWQDRLVSICFDSDTATNPNVLAARDGLAKELYSRGARVVFSINLPELKGAKCGLDDYLDAYDVEAFRALDVEELSSPYPRVRLWTGTELQSATIERPAPIVPGWGMRESAADRDGRTWEEYASSPDCVRPVSG